MDGKEQMINLGQYPAVGLADARRAASEASTRLANGLPAKGQASPVVAFGAVAAEWQKLQLSQRSPAYVKDIGQRLERHILPFLEGRPITEMAYNRAELWDDRRTLMEWWANFLTGED